MGTLRFNKIIDGKTSQNLREPYIRQLALAQEYYLELLVNKGSLYQILVDGLEAGYFILSENNILLEFFVLPEWVNRMDEYFGIILKEFGVTKALCKTFDTDLLFCCEGYQKSTSTAGFLFREFAGKPNGISPSGITVRRADMADESQIIAVNEEVFDHPEEVGQYIQAQQIFLFEKENNLVGFGIYSPVICGREDYDIGMLITPEFRHKGYGTFIIQYLVNFCRQNGWNPNAGCAVENTASRKCLEKAGFVTRHRLLKFLF